MNKTPNIPKISNGPNAANPHVDANTIAKKYSVSGRYILKLAAERRIPCLRLGSKCVRFDLDAVAEAFGACVCCPAHEQSVTDPEQKSSAATASGGAVAFNPIPGKQPTRSTK